MRHNGQRYAQYGVLKPLHYQDAERLKRATDAELRCSPRIAYDRMLPTGRSCYLSIYQSFTFYFCCIFNPCVGAAILFGKFWFAFWLVRLANVYGCEALGIFSS